MSNRRLLCYVELTTFVNDQPQIATINVWTTENGAAYDAYVMVDGHPDGDPVRLYDLAGVRAELARFARYYAP